MTKDRALHLHLISDATGETIHSLARACIAQFEGVEPLEHFWNMVRSKRQLAMVIDDIKQAGGVVIFSLVDPALRQMLEEACAVLNVPCVPVLDPVITVLEQHLGMESRHKPGRQHVLDEDYFARIEALSFAMAHDDGQNLDGLNEADAVLVGISRTSKTPTCIYLANRGVRAANIPLIPDMPPPPQLDHLTRPLIIGLTTDRDTLLGIRRQRMRMIAGGREDDYIDPERIEAEIRHARRLFNQRGWPVINTARRSIEETSAEIITMLSRHFKALPQGRPPEDPPSGGEA